MRARVLLAVAAALACGCAPVDGPIARYRLEQKMWRAQFYERRIKISFLQSSRQDMQRAIAGFRAVLADQALTGTAASSWPPGVADDMRAIRVASQIALANLYFLSERYADAGSMYEQLLEVSDLSLDRSLEARLGAARSMYLSGATAPVLEQCAEIFQELSQNPAFLDGSTPIDPVFMNVPVALVRMYGDAGNDAAAEKFAGLALAFYKRVADTGPETTANDASLGALQVCLVRQRWNDAVARLEAILARDTLPAQSRPGLELLMGEILAFRLDDTDRATKIFQSVRSAYPGSGFAFVARYNEGSLLQRLGDNVQAAEIFLSIERDNSAPAAVASRAMFSRAHILQQQGNWDDAYGLYRRINQLYPYTVAAIEAPIVVTRHFVARGETAVARRALDRARDYYVSLLDRGSAFPGDRLVVQSALAEAYGAVGETAEVAELLGAGSARWDEVSSAAGMLRSAELYATVLGDPGMAAEILKKCVERFPETRYANVAQRRLDELEGRPE